MLRKGTFATGKWTFSTVDVLQDNSGVNHDSANGIVVTSGGIYVCGEYERSSIVRFSSTGASGTWTTVDSFRLNSTGNAPSAANAIGTDGRGHLYVASYGEVGVLNGRTYSYNNYWIVRESNSGGAGSWSTVDNSQNWSAPDPAASLAHNVARAIGHDANGNIYVAGLSLIRTQPGGSGVSWTDSDIVSNSGSNPLTYIYYGFTADSFGNLYAGGEYYDQAGTVDDYFIRSQPAAPTNLTATPDPVLPSSQIDLSWTNAAGSDETGFAIYRSTDNSNFTLITTVTASTTSYNDSGLSAGTKYYYYVVTLLNSDGSSAPSGTVSVTTSM